MTRAEIAQLLATAAAHGLQAEEVERREGEQPTVRVFCPHCGAAFRMLRKQTFAWYIEQHVRVCVTKSPAERLLYLQRRRWTPELKHPLGVVRPLAKTGAERTRAWKARKRDK